MLIPARHIPSYFSNLRFPIEVRDPSGRHPVKQGVTRPYLERLIQEGVVEAIGSKRTIRYVRLRITPVARAVMWLKTIYPLIGEDSITSVHDREVGWKLIMRRCLAYGGAMREIH